MKNARLTQDEIKKFPSLGGLVITKQVIDEQMPPRFVLKDKPGNEHDSGWVIFSGMESDEYTDNPDNFGIYDAKTLLSIHPSPKLAEILLNGWIGSVFEYDEDEKRWYDVDDYPLENDYMTTHRLTQNWIIDINNLFVRKVEEDGSLLYTTGDKSLRMCQWIDENRPAEEVLAYYRKTVEERDESEATTIEKFDLSDDKITRIGYQIREKDDRKSYDVIYAFSIYEREIMQSVFYFDHPKDIDWALDAWRNTRLIEDK